MVTLKLALDAQGFKAGAAGVVGDLRTIQQEAQKAGEAVNIYGSGAVVRNWEVGRESVLKYGKAIEAVTEVTQVGGRVRLLGEEIKNLGSGFGSAAGVAQTFAGALIDVAQVAQKADGSLKGFALALRANPILAAAGVISLIASAMALFGGETEKTTTAIERQVDALEELRRAGQSLQERIKIDEELQRGGFGVDTARAAEDRARALAEQIARLRTEGNFAFGPELRSITGLSNEEIVRRAPQGSVGFAPTFGADRSQVPFSITPEGLRDVLRQLVVELRQTAQAGAEFNVPRFGSTPYGPPVPPGGMVQEQVDPYQAALSAYQRGSAQPGLNAVGLAGPTPFGPPVDIGQLQQAEQAQAEFNRELERTRQLGVDVGTALGNSFFAFAQNASNARSVLVGLLQQLSAIAQQRIVQGFANAVGNAFAPTNTQQTTRTPGTE